MYKKIFSSISIVFPLIFGLTVNANAMEFVVSGNGADSVSKVAVEVSQSINVTQSNTASIENNVNANANTGGNEANGNSGLETTVETGNADVTTNVENSDINKSSAVAGCCESFDVEAKITDNGSGSTNSLNASFSDSIALTQENDAYINSSVTTNANTGENSANNNNGNTGITTGNIDAETNVENKNINHSSSDIKIGGISVSLIIDGNGTDSINSLAFDYQNITSNHIYNRADIINIILNNLNTGGNLVNGNGGDVYIKTGDISVISALANDGINKSESDINCCEKESPPHDGDDNNGDNGGGDGDGDGDDNGNGDDDENPENGEDNGNQDVLGAGGNGQILAASTGQILPETGSFLSLIGILLSFILLFAGLYLRFCSDLSPPFLKL